MSAPEKTPPPSVEYSQKYMSWHLKEMNETTKQIALALKSIDESIRRLATIMSSNNKINTNVVQDDDLPF